MAEKDQMFEDFGSIVEPDSSLDINVILAGANTAEDSSEEEEEDKTKTKKVSEDDALTLNVNRVLAGAAEVTKDIKSVKKEDTDIEEEDETEDIDKTSPDLQRTEKSPSSDAPFTVIFARDLNDRGMLSSFDEEKFTELIEEKGEAEALRSLIQEEVDLNVEAAKADFDEGYKTYLQLVGKGVDSEEAGGLLQLQEFFGNVKDTDLDENEDLRRDVLTRYYQATTQLTDAKIKKMVDRSVDIGDDVEESKECVSTINGLIKEEIKKAEAEAERQQALAKEEQQRQLGVLKESIDSINEVIPGQKINKQTKDKMYAAIVKPVQDKFGNTTNSLWAKRAEDPLFFDARLAYLLETGFFEKGKAWDKLKNVKVTKEVSELDDFISKQRNVTSRVGSPLGVEPEEEKRIRKIISDTESIL